MSFHDPCLEGDLSRLIELLSQQNADINETDDEFRTPLHYAAFSGSYQCVSYLLKQEDIEIDKKDKYGMSPLQLAGNKYINSNFF